MEQRVSASVLSMWRYPVKSMLGEEIDAASVGERGVAGDRAYALVDVETGKIVSAKNPRRWGMLFECRARFLEEPDAASAPPPPAEITLPEGSTVRTDADNVHDVLTKIVGRAVRLETEAPATPVLEEYWPDVAGVPDDQRETVTDEQIGLLAPPGTFFDGAPMHLVTTATLTALRKAYADGQFDARRFRPNVVVECGEEGFVENGWVGQHVTVGAVDVHVLLAVPRCVMTTLAQDDLPQDKGILQTIAKENRLDIPGLGPSSCVGVYGIVTKAGTIRLGDRVRPGAPAPAAT